MYYFIFVRLEFDKQVGKIINERNVKINQIKKIYFLLKRIVIIFFYFLLRFCYYFCFAFLPIFIIFVMFYCFFYFAFLPLFFYFLLRFVIFFYFYFSLIFSLQFLSHFCNVTVISFTIFAISCYFYCSLHFANPFNLFLLFFANFSPFYLIFVILLFFALF